MFLLLLQTSVPLYHILLPCMTKMRATFIECLLWAMPYVKHFVYIGLVYLLRQQFHELSTSRGNKVSEKFSKYPKVTWLVNGGVRVSTLADRLQLLTENHQTTHIPPSRVCSSWLCRWVQAVLLRRQLPCLLSGKSCQIFHPVLGPGLYFYLIEKVFVFNPMWSGPSFVTHPWRPSH